MSLQAASEPEEAEAAPTSVGSYRITGLLGSGGMGVVYVGEQTHPRREVALKTVHSWLRAESVLQRFHDEVQALGSLLHPSIPQVYEAIEEQGRPWLAMELVRGRPIDEATRGWSERRIIAVLIEVCDAVEHASNAGLVHGDIKPANVLVGDDERPKVLDFGLAQRIGDPRLRIGGTPSFMSPGRPFERVPDVLADVFALGRLGAHLLPLATGDTRAILEKATADDRSARYRSAAALAEDLRRLLARLPISARPRTPIYVTERFLSRHRRIVIGAVLIALVAGCILGWRSWAESTRQERRFRDAESARIAIEAVIARSTPEQAARSFAAFVEAPSVQGTPALATAWANEAGRREEAGDVSGAVDALARAYLVSLGDRERTEVKRRLAATLDANGQLRALARLSTSLSREGVELGSLEVPAALARRDLDSALQASSPAPPILRALARGTFVPEVDAAPTQRGALRHGDLLYLSDPRRRQVLVHQLPTLERVSAHPYPERLSDTPIRRPVLLPGEPPLFAARQREEYGVWRVEASGLARVATLDHPRVLSALRLDDGRLLAGVGPTPRGLWAGLPEGAGFRFEDAHPATSILDADVIDLDAGDLDGDGEAEVIAALGAWGGFAVRVYKPTASGLELVTDYLMGYVSWVRVFRGQDGVTRILAVRAGGYENQQIFGSETPGGRAEGLYVLRLEDGELVNEDTLPPPFKDEAGDAPLITDLDGDGDDEILHTVRSRKENYLRVIYQAQSGAFESVTIRGLAATSALELDSDPAGEVWLNVSGSGHFIAGVGDTPLPVLGDVDLVPPELPALARAEELVQLGLFEVGIAAMEEEARRTADDPTAAAIWARVASISASSGQDLSMTAARWQRAAERGAAGPAQDEATREAASAWRDAGEYARALPLFERLAGRDASAAAAALEARAIVEAPRVTIPANVPLSAVWQVQSPRSIAPHSSGQRLRTWSGQGDILVRRLVHDGGVLGLEVELDVSRLDLGAGVEVLLRRPGEDAPLLAAAVVGHGGGLDYNAKISCLSGERIKVRIADPIDVDAADLEARISARLLPDGRVLCESGNGRVGHWLGERPHPAGGPLELVVRGVTQTAGMGSQLADVVLRRITVSGARLLPVEPTAVEHPLLSALEADDLPRVRTLLAEARATPDERDVVDLLRTHHRALLPELVKLDPEYAATLVGQSWQSAARWVRSNQAQALLDEPALTQLRSNDPAFLQVLLYRAELARVRGEVQREARVLHQVRDVATPALVAEAELKLAAHYLRLGDRTRARLHVEAHRRLRAAPLDRQRLAWLYPELVDLLASLEEPVNG